MLLKCNLPWRKKLICDGNLFRAKFRGSAGTFVNRSIRLVFIMFQAKLQLTHFYNPVE